MKVNQLFFAAWVVEGWKSSGWARYTAPPPFLFRQARFVPTLFPRAFSVRRLVVWALILSAAWALHRGQVLVDVLARGADIQAHEQVRPLQPTWVVPDDPFFRAGQMSNGQWSVVRMLEAWKQAGLTADQAAEVLVFFHERLLPTVTDASLVDRRKAEWSTAQTTLRQALPHAWKTLEDLSPKDRVAPIDWALAESGQETLEWVQLLGEVGSLAPSLTDLPLDGLSLEEARDAVKAAVRTAGLKQLNVPLAVWSDPTRMADMAAGIEQANRDLEAITGWSGGVLGLDGRLTLTLGTIDVALVDGRQADGQRLEMETDWRDLSHEWLHALDFTMARRSQQHPRFGTLTSHRDGWVRHWRAVPAARSWWAAVEQMETAGQPWVDRRQKAVDEHVLARRTDMKGYWTDPTELMAFAWEARTRRLEGLVLLGEKALPLDGDHASVISPKPVELMAMEPAWDPLLEGARQALGFERHAPALRLKPLPRSPNESSVPASGWSGTVLDEGAP